MAENLDEDIDAKSNKKKYLTWTIIAFVVVAVIAIPMVVMRQSEPTEATEPATIEQLEAEVDALYVTVYGTDEVEGLEAKLAKQAELIANIQTGDCICPDWTGQLSSINSDITTLRSDMDAIVVQDYSANITQIDADLTTLSTDLTAAATALTELQAQVDALVVTVADCSSDIDRLDTGIASLETDLIGMESDITMLEGEIDSLDIAIEGLEDRIASLPSLPRYAVVTGMTDEYLEVAVVGAGKYPVVVTLYDLGEALALDQVWVVYPADYDIIDEMLYASGKILALFIMPDDPWEATDTITLVIYSIRESIDYATASVGG